MRKRIFGRKLKRDKNERKALFRSLMISLVLHGKIRTTEAKAKSIKGDVEKLVTVAKNKGEDAKGQVLARMVNEFATDKLIKEIAPLFSSRPGGYTRIVRLGERGRDGAGMVLLSWVETVPVTSLKPEKRNKNKKEKVKALAPAKETKAKEEKGL